MTALSSPTSAAIPSGLSEQTLLLDSDIRDWVVLPLLVIMVCAGLLRHYMGILLKANPKSMPLIESRVKNLLMRAQKLRTGAANYISSQKWEARRNYLADKETGYLRQEQTWATEHAEKVAEEGGGDMMNPMAMMDGMKGSMAFMVQNMVMMQGISHFFQGFILLKVPFPLTRGFKAMFQRGMDSLTNLDTSYVSSVSWYFLVMFGLRSFFRLMIGDPSQEQMETNKVNKDLGLHVSATPQPFDAQKALQTEADNLELLPKFKSNFDDVEKRLLGKQWPKKTIAAKDDLFGYGSVTSNKGGKKRV